MIATWFCMSTFIEVYADCCIYCSLISYFLVPGRSYCRFGHSDDTAFAECVDVFAGKTQRSEYFFGMLAQDGRWNILFLGRIGKAQWAHHLWDLSGHGVRQVFQQPSVLDLGFLEHFG